MDEMKGLMSLMMMMIVLSMLPSLALAGIERGGWESGVEITDVEVSFE